MKAKLKKTGEIIEVTFSQSKQFLHSFYKDDNGNEYINDDLDFNVPAPNWEQIRIQAAIAAMQGMMAAISPERFTVRISEEAVAKASVEYADSLIKELKKKK